MHDSGSHGFHCNAQKRQASAGAKNMSWDLTIQKLDSEARQDGKRIITKVVLKSGKRADVTSRKGKMLLEGTRK